MQLWDFFSWGLKNEFETAVVNEPSVFEPLKFYCNKRAKVARNRPSDCKSAIVQNVCGIEIKCESSYKL